MEISLSKDETKAMKDERVEAVDYSLYFYNSRHKMMFELKTAKWLRLSHV